MTESRFLTGTLNTDIQLLLQLEDSDLERLCVTNSLFFSICNSPELWTNKIIDRFGEPILKLIQRFGYSPKQFYHRLITRDFSVGIANVALAQRDEIIYLTLKEVGISPDINLNIGPQGAQVGFSTPFTLHPEMLTYLQNTDLGPIIAAEYSQGNPTNLQNIPGSDLKEIMYSLSLTINGQPNPLFGVIDVMTVTVLFNLLIRYQHWRSDVPNRFRISNEMRQSCPTILRNMLDQRIAREAQLHPEDGDHIRQVGEYHKMLIDHPEYVMPEIHPQIPNLNAMSYPQLTNLVVASRAAIGLNPEVRESVAEVYNWLFLETPEPIVDSVIFVLAIQQRSIKSAAEFAKNQLMAHANQQ